jgi:hypothetical protein
MPSLPRLFLILGLGLPALACGSSSSSPVGPTSTPSPVAHGATIQGTVETGFSGSSVSTVVHASSVAVGIRVSAIGTSLFSTTDASGHFVLAGVPGLKAELRFEGQGIDARLEVSGLAEDRSITINVHVSGSQALLAESDDKGAEATLRGAVESIDGSVLRVAGKKVVTDGSTQFLGKSNTPASLKDLRVGDSVEVEGAVQADGSVYARKVKREDGNGENEPPESEVGFKGAIQGLSPFVVAGQTVVTNGNTKILDKNNSPIPFSALKVGQTAEVEGTTQANGSVLAKKVKLDD